MERSVDARDAGDKAEVAKPATRADGQRDNKKQEAKKRSCCRGWWSGLSGRDRFEGAIAIIGLAFVVHTGVRTETTLRLTIDALNETRRSNAAMEQANDIARKALIAGNAPKIVINSNGMTPPDNNLTVGAEMAAAQGHPGDVQVSFFVDVANVGELGAINVQISPWMTIGRDRFSGRLSVDSRLVEASETWSLPANSTLSGLAQVFIPKDVYESAVNHQVRQDLITMRVDVSYATPIDPSVRLATQFCGYWIDHKQWGGDVDRYARCSQAESGSVAVQKSP